MATYKELKAQAEALAAQVEQARQDELRAVIEEVRAKVDEYRLTAHDVFGRRRAQVKRKSEGAMSIQPKYQDPKSGATWTGRGLEPQWIRGKSREAFLIEWE
jgi:DNA-binding protein H-NS